MDRRTILVADDDRLVRVTVAHGLRGAGYAVLEAADGHEAVEVGVRELPDLAILDLRMPGLSGVEAARRLREDSEVPCMILSAYGQQEEVEGAVREGALGYLVKPVEVATMLPAIETALGRAAEISRLRASEAQLSRALSRGREASVAVGILIERYHLSREQAFERLRTHARSQRRKLSEVATEIVSSTEALNALAVEVPGPAARHQSSPRRPRGE